MRVSFHSRLCNLHNLNIQNLNILLRLLLINPRILNLMNNIQTLNRPPKNGMLIIQPRLQHINQHSFSTPNSSPKTMGVRELTVFSVVMKN
jgi:hypothetical protein